LRGNNEKLPASWIIKRIEAPRRRAGGESSTVRTFDRFQIRSLTPPQAAGNALAVSVQGSEGSRVQEFALFMNQNFSSIA